MKGILRDCLRLQKVMLIFLGDKRDFLRRASIWQTDKNALYIYSKIKKNSIIFYFLELLINYYSGSGIKYTITIVLPDSTPVRP